MLPLDWPCKSAIQTEAYVRSVALSRTVHVPMITRLSDDTVYGVELSLPRRGIVVMRRVKWEIYIETY